MAIEVLKNFVIAMVLGGLIGLQREHIKEIKNKITFAGIRSFILISLSGAMAVYLTKFDPLIFVILLAGFLIFMVVAYFIESRISGAIGTTSELAAILTFILGALCMMGEIWIAIPGAIVVTLILAMKESMHSFAKNLSDEEIYSTLKFAIIAFIILPILPNQAYGPLEIFNPYVIWLMVVLISGLSFGAYILIRIFGTQRGIVLTGILGGFISSTGLTISLSEQSKKLGKVINPFVFGILVAGATMFFRIMLEVYLINKSLVSTLILPMGLMGLTGLGLSLYFLFKREKVEVTKEQPQIKSPFTMTPALKFGIFFALILVVTKAATLFFGNTGAYVVSFFSGLVAVDALTISMAKLALTGDVTPTVATTAITIAAATNTAVKAGIAMWMASRPVGWRVLAVYAVVLLVGLLSILFL